MSERVKLADAGLITSLSDTDNMLLESGGSMRRAALSTFTDKVMGDMNVDMITDNVWIAYKTLSSHYDCWASLSRWPSLQANGNYASGVAIYYPGKILVVAPTGSSTTLPIASSRLRVGETVVERRDAALDMDGQGRTAALLAASDSDFVCNTADYAPGFCNQYERLNSEGYGQSAGSWWLPSSGELAIIAANIKKVNYALSLIDGAEQIGSESLWSSTHGGTSDGFYWFFQFSNTLFGFTSATSGTSYRVRPVSEWGM